MRPKRLGIRFEGFESLADARSIATEAEAAGASSLWMTQHLGGRDAATLATIIAAGTARIRVVPSNLSPFIVHPTTTAMVLSTLAELAPGRVAASIGIGNPLDLAQSGIVAERPEDAVCDFVDALERLFERKPVQVTGRTYRLDGARLSIPASVAIPLYITALEPRMARRAGATSAALQLSAGFSPAFAAACIEAFDGGAAEASTDASDRPRAAFVYFGTDDTASIEGVRRKLAYLFRNRLMAENIRSSGLPIDQATIIDCIARHDLDAATRLVPDAAIEVFAVTGNHTTCVSAVRRFFDAGVDELLINVGSSAAERRAAFDLIAAINH
ncbi:MAG: LLM class flavin-dependent oxidoreductase [Proteobacteria bacterium]|nr:LLM class flavin-dependent oxidoreductase [Burkholderiales bacterium]